MPVSVDVRTGLAAGVGSMLLWGSLPLYFKALQIIPADLMLAHRVLWSALLGLVILFAAQELGRFWATVYNWRVFALLCASGAIIGANWFTYILAVFDDRIMEASLGYYINPLLTFLCGALFFGERFSKVQLAAILLAVLGVFNQWLVVGVFPIYGLGLCITFAAYAVIRKSVDVDSRVGFAFETLILAPLALAFLYWSSLQGRELFAPTVWQTGLLTVGTGVFTAAPLILFTMAARRLRLSTIGLLQFMGPTLQLVLAVILGEVFTAAHGITFGLIWSGVGLFCWSLWNQERERSGVSA